MTSADDVKKLRDMTGISVMQCKQALEEAGGDFEKAVALLREKGAAIAAKKADRTLGAGTIAAYVHQHTIGVLLELRSETDFVAKNEEFIALARELAMHVAAAAPADAATLLDQPFIKDESRAVRTMIEGATQKFGERIEVGQFVRYSVK